MAGALNSQISHRALLMSPILFFLILISLLDAQTRFVAPVERSGFTRVTSYDTLQAFLKNIGSTPFVQVEPLTKSRTGRTLSVAKVSLSKTFGQDPGKLRVLLFGQQHGDEHTGKEALSMLLAKFASGELKDVLQNVDVLIVPQMNPDGGELYQRRTSDSVDLNRNHVLLTSPETRALHDLFYRWMPHVTLDLHEYGTLSRSWSDSGFIRIADAQLGMLTNVNTSPEIRNLQHNGIFPYIAGYMHGQGSFYNEYIVGSPSDRVRHSTTEINDGRQSFGVLGAVSFIQEGIKWRTREDRLERRVQSHLTAVRALLEYCSHHAHEIVETVQKERSRLLTLAGQPVALRMDHTQGKGELRIPVRMLRLERDTTWLVKPYFGEVKLQKSTVLPEKYFIERKDSAIVELLRRHHINVEEFTRETELSVSAFFLDSVSQVSIEEETQPLVFVTSRQIKKTFRPGDFVISTHQLQSLLMAIILEPESIWGLTKYEQFAYLLKQAQYPVYRLP
ncbi:MAG: M14 family zinc carboxypeptidase [Bacteroidota bacterium]